MSCLISTSLLSPWWWATAEISSQFTLFLATAPLLDPRGSFPCMYNLAVSQRSQQMEHTDFGPIFQIFPIVVHLWRITSPLASAFWLPSRVLKWLFIIFFSRFCNCYVPEGMPHQATVLLPAGLVLFYSVHFFDEISYLFIRYDSISF